MTRKPKKLYLFLLPTFVAVAFLALGIVALGGYGFLDRLLLGEQEENLETQAKILRDEINYLLLAGRDRLIDERCESLGRETGYRYTVILAGGEVVGDSAVGVAEMDNHLARPEVRKALNGEVAVDMRDSLSTGEKFLFVAVPLNSGDPRGVLRIAKPFDSMMAVLKTAYFRFLSGLLLVLGVALLFSLGFARRLTRPLERLVGFVRGIGDDGTPVGELDETGFPTEFLDLRDAILTMLGRLKGYIVKLTERGHDLEEKTSKLDRLAHYDPLTGLPNRTMLYPAVEGALSRAREEGTELALLFFDLDRFKEVNDSFGHETGDLLLQAVAERLKTRVGNRVLVARLGGDEFCVLSENATGRDEAIFLARTILQEMERPFEIRSHVLKMTLSIGISLFPGDGETREELLHAADMAMYDAKRNGRGSFAFVCEGALPLE